ncbi:MAG: serine/threonine-protein kinase [Chloroflexota bacterium]
MVWTAGEQVGAYVLDNQLGQGGMATVYKAHHANLKRDVAVKVMHQNFLDDESFVARFKREAEIVAQLTHPHIVPVYDFDEHAGQPYLVMKYVPGFTLKKQLIKNPPDLEGIIEIVAAIADALTFAHERDILHRDVKPSNVIIDTDGKPYLTDFGLARLASSGESTMSADMLLGTPHYISPEQARGTKVLDGRTDVYALGVMVYEMLVGKVPFTGDSAFSIIHDHIYSPLPPPTKVNPELPDSVEEVLYKALAKSPEDRYDTPNDMVADLRVAIRSGALTELNPERGVIAEATLADIREAMENTPTQIIETGVKSPTSTSSSGIRTARLVAKQDPFYNRERFWTISGCASLLLITFVSLGILLGMSATMQELASLSELDVIADDSSMVRDANEVDGDIVIDVFEGYDITVMDTGVVRTLDISVVPFEDLPTDIENPLDALVRARSLYSVGQIEDARSTLITNMPSDERGRTEYLLNAIIMASEDDIDLEGAILYAAIALETASTNDLLFESVRAIAGETLYYGTVNVGVDVLNSPLQVLGRQNFISEDALTTLLDSPYVNYVVIRGLLLSDNEAAARINLARVEVPDNFLPEFSVLRADLQLQLGNDGEAIALMNGILERNTAPQWVLDIATRYTEGEID